MRTARYEGPFDTRASEWIGDLTVWNRQNAADNSERLERLRRNLRQARERELTPRQGPALPMPPVFFVDFSRENPGFSCRFVHFVPLFLLRFCLEADIIKASAHKETT